MRAGLSTIQQTLTPEAASVLNHSIAEAGRRNHGQTTPLHVAATLLASPSGFLRQACIKSHPNSSHPLQCRALELCFSVALDRLPTAQNISPGLDPPISNALMAALKRAQAHQRRGCPEQQQQPLLAVKVELEQLIISILDDPSVSRVMREASFSSPAVKATIEQSLNSTACSVSVSNSSSIGLGFRPNLNRNLYVNPRLQQGAGGGLQSGQQRGEEVKRVMDILMRSKKKNPVLVGESEPEKIVKELLIKIESKELDCVLKNVEVIRLGKDFSFEKGEIVAKLRELSGLIESKMIGNGGVIVDLGDLKWLVEQQLNFGGSNSGAVQHQQVVAEMGKMLIRFGGGSGGGGRLWLIGAATCETYLRCQVYHPSMENDWDLQAVPIAAKALPGMFPRLGSNGNGIPGSSVESSSPLKGFPAAPTRWVSENMDPVRKMSCCPQCMQNYEQELGKLAKEFEKPSSEVKLEAARPSLPQWLHNAKAHDDAKTVDQTLSKDQDLVWKQKSQEVQKKWNDTCLHLHPNFHQPGFGMERIVPGPLSMTGLYNQNLLARQSFQPKLQLNRNLEDALQSNTNLVSNQQSGRFVSPTGSPVRTDLVLGRSKESKPEKNHQECVKDFLGCISSERQNKCHEMQSDKLPDTVDADSFKSLAKGLLEKVWWQQEAATAVATTVTQCKLGNGMHRGAGSKGDTWLLFTGPDRVGKKKMASVLSELVCSASPIMISLGSRRDDGDSDVNIRGKTTLDRIGEAVKRHPFSVILLEDIDEADMLLRGSIKRAMERGRLIDSHGREINLGKVIFILTANWLPDSLKFLSHGITLNEKKLASLASGGWQLRLSLWEKTAKRRPSWLNDEVRSTKTRKETGFGLSFDLNQAADVGDDKADGSHNSSDVTIDHEEEHGLNNRLLLSPSTSPASHDLLNSVDSAIVFKPVDFSTIRRNISNSITKKFSSIVGNGVSLDILDEALEKIVGGVWFGRTGLEEWLDKVLVPSLHQLKSRLPTNASVTDESMVVRLETDDNSGIRSLGDLLPSSIKVVVEGL